MFLPYSLIRVMGLALILSFFFFGSRASENVHKCSGAGFWFSRNPGELAKEVDTYMTKASSKQVQGHIIAMISPHAGYRYAGPVMGAGYRQLKGLRYKRVVILAFSHSAAGFGKISVLPVESYETPLGAIPVDKKLVDDLLKQKDVFTSIPPLHKQEHSDENQLPFLQRAFGNFSLVSLMVDQLDDATMNKAAEILAPYLDQDTLFIASTDLNHYGTGYEYAPFTSLKGEALVKKIHEHDQEALKHIAALDWQSFRSYIERTGATVCGKNPVELLLRVLKKKDQVSGQIMDYYTSSDKGGDYEERTCGYGSVIFTVADQKSEIPVVKKEDAMKKEEQKQEKKQTLIPGEEPDPPILSEAEQKTLLTLSRDVLEGITKDHSFKPDLSKYDLTPNLKQNSRLFVTLTEKGELRGCIGHVEAIMPIYQGVIDNTFSAAFRDSRFPPVRSSDVPDIRIEISINTPQRLIKDVNQIEIGKHGLIIEKGFHRGLLLPQVPVEWKWDLDEFLKGICRKAGLPDGAWKDPDTKLYIYSSQVFHEPEKK